MLYLEGIHIKNSQAPKSKYARTLTDNSQCLTEKHLILLLIKYKECHNYLNEIGKDLKYLSLNVLKKILEYMVVANLCVSIKSHKNLTSPKLFQVDSKCGKCR